MTESKHQSDPHNDEERRALAYGELRSLAENYLRGQRVGHTLQPTALVHEAYARLLHSPRMYGVDAGAFVVMAAKAMRSVLIDHARKRATLKRSGGLRREPLDEVVDLYEAQAIDLISLDEAMSKLGDIDPQQVRVIELRFFGGLSETDTAEMLGVSSRTVGRMWRRARAWLRREMGDENES